MSLLSHLSTCVLVSLVLMSCGNSDVSAETSTLQANSGVIAEAEFGGAVVPPFQHSSVRILEDARVEDGAQNLLATLPKEKVEAILSKTEECSNYTLVDLDEGKDYSTGTFGDYYYVKTKSGKTLTVAAEESGHRKYFKNCESHSRTMVYVLKGLSWSGYL